MHRILGSLLLYVALLGGHAFADGAYISIEQLNLARLLAPPPASQSDQQRLDLAAVLKAQQERTSSQAERAVADNELSIFRTAGEILGPNFTAQNVPKTAAFFDRVNQDVAAAYVAAKDLWKRPRPFQVSPDVQAIGALPRNSGSYPSGHSTQGYLAAIILANMVPEKSGALFARGREYGENRVVAGVHFPTDVEAGRLAATALSAVFMQNPAFLQDFAEARSELRQALGLQ